MLVTTQEGLEETQQLPPQMCAHCTQYHQPEAMGGAHLLTDGERAGRDMEMIETKLMQHRLESLEHLAQMRDHRLPEMCLFG